VPVYSPYRLILTFALVAVLRTTGEWSARVFFNAYLDTSLGTSTLVVGLLLALGQLMGLTALLAPLAIKRWGKMRTVGWGMVFVACSLLPLALVPHQAVAGFCYITIIAIAVLTNPAYNVFSQDLVAPPWRPTMSGAMFMAFGLSVSVVALGGGYLAGAVGYSAVFLLAALFTVSGGIFFLFYFRKPRGELAHVAPSIIPPVPTETIVT
jgi:predicted MFS family arabinose efflux permease